MRLLKKVVAKCLNSRIVTATMSDSTLPWLVIVAYPTVPQHQRQVYGFTTKEAAKAAVVVIRKELPNHTAILAKDITEDEDFNS